MGKYEEALERAKAGKPIDEVFPELSESEDERIRKEIINFLRSPFVNENIADEKIAPWVAYLEKQKESLHIPETCKENADSFTDENERIRKGLIEYLESDRDYQPCQDVSFYDDAIAYLERQKEQQPVAHENDFVSKEQKPAEWSEDDEEILDIVLTMVDCSTVVPHSGRQLHPSKSYKKDISNWLKSLRPQPHWKPSEE